MILHRLYFLCARPLCLYVMDGEDDDMDPNGATAEVQRQLTRKGCSAVRTDATLLGLPN